MLPSALLKVWHGQVLDCKTNSIHTFYPSGGVLRMVNIQVWPIWLCSIHCFLESVAIMSIISSERGNTY